MRDEKLSLGLYSARHPTDERYKLGEHMYANEAQREAIDRMIEFLDSKDTEFLLRGRGGTGKSTVIRKVIEYYRKNISIARDMFGDDVIAATISHAAKNVLFNFLGRAAEVVTIARLLGMKQNITEEGEIEFTPIPTRFDPPIRSAYLIVIDECSMISKSLLKTINELKQPNAKIIYMGDNVQLPPIDTERKPNEDSITFDIENYAELLIRIRQGEDSPILPVTDLYANNIEDFNSTGNMVKNPLLLEHCKDNYNEDSERGVLFVHKFGSVLDMLLHDFKSEEAEFNPNYCRAIAYRNKNPYGRAPYNVGSINVTVRKHLWGDVGEFVEGDRVIANNNFMEKRQIVFHNSDSMIVLHVAEGDYLGVPVNFLDLLDQDGHRVYDIPVVSLKGRNKLYEQVKELVASAQATKNWKKVYDYKGLFADIAYGYAVNSHKAQGSTYRNVYVIEDDIFSVKPTTNKEKNQSMYVACTRPSHKLVIFSERFKEL